MQTSAESGPRPLRDELAELTLALCRIASETGAEGPIAGWVEARCRGAAGLIGTERVGNSVICAPPLPSVDLRLPTVALVGHLDTVRCAAAQPYEIRDGRVYGCGASDMKGGVAVMLALLERWRELQGARPLWIFYDAEEGPYANNGLERVFASGALPAIDFAFILEPTDQAVQPGCMGVLNASVTVRGRRAHAARPWQGENALYRAVPLLVRLGQMRRREVRVGELVFYEVMTATQARTTNSANVVPDEVAFNVNVRFAPGRTVAEAEAELREVVGNDGEVVVTDSAPAGEVMIDHPLVSGWRIREKLPVQPKQAWTDLARFTEQGIAAVNFGPGETAQAHQAGESCSIDSLEFTYYGLRRFFAGS